MVSDKQRQRAINWLNSEKRTFEDGLTILEDSGFKPAVARRLRMLGDTPANREHLTENMYQYIRHIGAEVEDTDPDIGVINGVQPADVKSEGKASDSILTVADKISNGALGVPDGAGDLIIDYAHNYRERERLHRSLLSMGEDNDADTISKRKEVTDKIDELTDRLENDYPRIRAFLDNGILPPPPSEPETPGSENQDKTELDDLTKEQLQKMLKSAKTKVLRKTNMLLYQQETKAKKENPMPDCPKRTKYETAIAALQEEISKLEYAIARKG